MYLRLLNFLLRGDSEKEGEEKKEEKPMAAMTTSPSSRDNVSSNNRKVDCCFFYEFNPISGSCIHRIFRDSTLLPEPKLKWLTEYISKDLLQVPRDPHFSQVKVLGLKEIGVAVLMMFYYLPLGDVEATPLVLASMSPLALVFCIKETATARLLQALPIAKDRLLLERSIVCASFQQNQQIDHVDAWDLRIGELLSDLDVWVNVQLSAIFQPRTLWAKIEQIGRAHV